MNGRIFRAMLALTLLALLLVSTALCIVFYRQFSSNVRAELRERAAIFKGLGTHDITRELADFKPTDMRITLISQSGVVLFDNAVDANRLGVHLGREEVDEALADGEGESSRFSDTMHSQTYYYAVRMADGSILRVSKTVSSVIGMFTGALPAVAAAVAIVFIAGYLLAKMSTARIVAPINAVDLNEKLSAPYDELIPFVSTIERQRADIARNIADLEARAGTISAIIENMSEGIMLVDPRGRMLSMNKSAAALLNLSAPEPGREVLEMTRNIELIAALRKALAGERSELVLEHGGRTCRVFVSSVAGGGAIILALDITGRAMAEQMRREFSANVSHELKTPLTSIYGNAEMLLSGMVKPADTQAFYAQIKNEASRLIALIEDILLISRLDEGKSFETPDDIELAQVAAECAEALAQKAREQSVSLHISGQAQTRGARAMIYEMLYNLIDNAIKYNVSGGEVHIEASTAGARAVLTVTDTGVGIPESALPRVFERFFRADKSRSKHIEGSGLGLAICKHIAALHKGEISLESREGEGTSVTVSLPL